jgi:hypothetical protein
MGVNLSQKTRRRRRKPDDPMNGIPEPKVRPIILAVDDGRKDLGLVARELRKRYEAAYHVACEARSGPDSSGRGVSRRPGKASGQGVAVVLAGRRIAGLRKPGMSGAHFLARVRGSFDLAKRSLLLDPMDTETRSLLPRATALGRIYYFEFKPGAPPTSGSTGS